MCLFHWTGDRKWLAEPFQPRRDVRLIPDRSAGFDEATQQQIKDAAYEVLADGVPTAAIDNPGDDLFHEMMNVCLGETVAPEYVSLMRQDMGWESGDARWSTSAPADLEIEVIIVGAGLSGLGLATKLDGLGIPFVIVDKNADVGGTWFENRYPGCGVDTPNHFYSYSFAPNPAWKHYFSPRDELQAYVQACADDFGLRSRIRYETTVTAATWNEDERRWAVTLRSGDDEEVMQARIVVAATGHFNQPVVPTFDGQESFSGDILHTARWDRSTDLSGRRVAIIGTGASAMQLVPTVAADLDQLTIFQRTAQWARPVAEYNEPVNPAAQWLFENLTHYSRWYRFNAFWRYGDGLLRHLRKDPDWPHPDRSLNRTNDRHRQEMTDFITDELEGRPDLIEKCVPTYPPFGKRILIDNGWFETLRQPNVTLTTSSIRHFEPDGIRSADGRLHEVDTIITATGFAVTNLAGRIDVTGRRERRLADDWADENPTAFLGMTVPDFPNFFVMYGPNTNMGHGGSAIFVAESQARYITHALVAMAEAGVDAIDCRPERRSDYTDEIDSLHEALIWTHPGMTTYYRNSHGKVRSPMPFRLVDYWSRTRSFNFDDYRLSHHAAHG